MIYKLLGLAVWRGGKWYLRKRTSGVKRKLLIGGLAAAVVGGVIAVQGQQDSAQ